MNDIEGTRLPIKLDTTSNGEFAPVPLSPRNRLANRIAHERASENAKRLGLTRRRFLVSAAGAASTLVAFNQAQAARGGYFDVPAEASLDGALALEIVGQKREFIFDVQGHFVDPSGAWTKKVSPNAFSFAPKSACGKGKLECLAADEFIKDVFRDSDTDMMVLSFVPSAPDSEPLTIQAADAVREIVDKIGKRLLVHGRVQPNEPRDIARMDELKERWHVAAWKTYTQFGPGGRGFFLSDDVGTQFIEKARALGVKVVCVHKGLPFGPQSYEHSQCSDIGVVAKRFPDVKFLVYHSGFVTSVKEQPYDAAAKRDGIDTLVRSLLENGVAPNSNVYAELGSTWRFLMRDPEQAAHALGKLIKYCGEDNVLWGTDSIWYGSPQDQIQAFRTFQIGTELREKHGYAEMTPQLRSKIFGLSGAKVYGVTPIVRKAAEGRDPHFLTYGPKTRREFLQLRKLGVG
ncbi:MAG TPA: amidohydrolase family protein [Burkholderiales bacterium]|nr:amidohydrolase family protein [Burkholderiales bacterium]